MFVCPLGFLFPLPAALKSDRTATDTHNDCSEPKDLQVIQLGLLIHRTVHERKASRENIECAPERASGCKKTRILICVGL